MTTFWSILRQCRCTALSLTFRYVHIPMHVFMNPQDGSPKWFHSMFSAFKQTLNFPSRNCGFLMPCLFPGSIVLYTGQHWICSATVPVDPGLEGPDGGSEHVITSLLYPFLHNQRQIYQVWNRLAAISWRRFCKGRAEATRCGLFASYTCLLI